MTKTASAVPAWKFAFGFVGAALVAVSVAFYGVRRENVRLRALVRAADAQSAPECTTFPLTPSEKIEMRRDRDQRAEDELRGARAEIDRMKARFRDIDAGIVVPVGTRRAVIRMPSREWNALLADAVEAGDEISVKALLEKGADPNAVVPHHEDGLLAEAAWNPSVKIAELLLHYGADVNPKDRPSPLVRASYSENALPMMRLLIRAGAEVNPDLGNKATIISVARFHGGDEAVALLRRAGAHE